MRATILDQAINGTTAAVPGKWFALTRGGGVSLQLATTNTLVGAWQILASNKPGVEVDGDPSPTDITAAFKDKNDAAITAASTGGSSQFVQAGPLWAGSICAVFIPSSGSGNARAHANEVEKI